jgi:hypothetical protein
MTRSIMRVEILESTHFFFATSLYKKKDVLQLTKAYTRYVVQDKEGRDVRSHVPVFDMGRAGAGGIY